MTNRSEIFKRSSFGDKLRAGWTKEELMIYYDIDEEKYDRILASLKIIEEYHDTG